MSNRSSRKSSKKLILPNAEVVKKRQEEYQSLKDRLQEIRDKDFTKSEIFEEPRPSDNAGVTVFRLAMFLSQMTPLWKDRDAMFLKYIEENENE